MNNKKSVKDNRLSFDHNCASLLVGETAKCGSLSFRSLAYRQFQRVTLCIFVVGGNRFDSLTVLCSNKSGGRNRFDFGRVPLSEIMKY
jgi:hypothetical protein